MKKQLRNSFLPHWLANMASKKQQDEQGLTVVKYGGGCTATHHQRLGDSDSYKQPMSSSRKRNEPQMSSDAPARAGFTNNDVLESTAHGMLWLVEKVGCGNKWGLKRLRRGKDGWLYTSGKLVWKPAWCKFPEEVKPGKLIFSTPRGTSVLIDWIKKNNIDNDTALR